MVIEDSYVECPHCKSCQKKQDIIDNDGYCFDCENKIRKGLLKMKNEKLLNLIKEKRKLVMEDDTIVLSTYAQGFTDALDWMKSIIEKKV